MEELRLPLLILGIFAITGILVHGLWTIRKNAQKKVSRADTIKALSEEPDPRQGQDYAGFDEHGLGKVRVIQVQDPEQKKSEKRHHHSAAKRNEPMFVAEPEEDDVADSAPTMVANEPEPSRFFGKDDMSDKSSPEPSQGPKTPPAAAPQEPIPTSTAAANANASAAPSKTKPTTNYEYPDPPASLLLNTNESDSRFFTDVKKTEPTIERTEFLEDTPLDESLKAAVPKAPVATPEKAKKISLAEQAKKLVGRDKPQRQKARTEPKVDEEQLRIDFDDQPVAETKSAGEAKANAESEQNNAPPEQEVLVLNVKVPNEGTMAGSALLPMLLTLGFKFGQHEIFHRHVNSNGKGPTLFSLANMFAPGVFDIDNMETFKTQGVSLFMVLPIEGDPHQVFNMMHNAARKIADEFNAQILDSRRTLLTKQALQQYVDKIRESERRRKLKR